MRKGIVYFKNERAGIISEEEDKYVFAYDAEYLLKKDARRISLTFPLSDEPYESEYLFPFFDGLIPEGWLLDIAEDNWKLNPRDRMGLLLACCTDCIGAVSVEELKQGEKDE